MIRAPGRPARLDGQQGLQDGNHGLLKLRPAKPQPSEQQAISFPGLPADQATRR